MKSKPAAAGIGEDDISFFLNLLVVDGVNDIMNYDESDAFCL